MRRLEAWEPVVKLLVHTLCWPVVLSWRVFNWALDAEDQAPYASFVVAFLAMAFGAVASVFWIIGLTLAAAEVVEHVF